jgi:hypothetical protein
MSKGRNRNLIYIRREAEKLGAVVTGERWARRHVRLSMINAEGKACVMQISQSNIDKYKLKGWVRQVLTRPERPENFPLGNNARDQRAGKRR